MKTIGQATYEKWRDLIPPSSGPTISWNDLPMEAKEGWQDIGVAAIEQYALNISRGNPT